MKTVLRYHQIFYRSVAWLLCDHKEISGKGLDAVAMQRRRTGAHVSDGRRR